MGKILLQIFVLISFSTMAFSQSNCRIAKDSIIAGNGVSSYSNYIYDSAGNLVKVESVDSGSTHLSSYDTLYYTGSEVSKIESFYYDGSSFILYQTLIFWYTNGNITTVDASGTNSNGPWTLVHDLAYDGNGKLQSLVLDTSTGQPDGLAASLINIAWNNNNIVSAALLFMGDTLELTFTHDSTNNVQDRFVMRDAFAVLIGASANNVKRIQLTNNEAIGNAGDPLFNRTFTYENGRIKTVSELPTLFENFTTTFQVIYDCTSGIPTISENAARIFPNPAENILNIETAAANGNIRIFDAGAKLVLSENFQNNSHINISGLQSGIYFVELNLDGRFYQTKFLKK